MQSKHFAALTALCATAGRASGTPTIMQAGRSLSEPTESDPDCTNLGFTACMAAPPNTCIWEGTDTQGPCVNWSDDGHSSSSSSSHDCGSKTDNGEIACNGHGGGGACSWNSASGICEDDTTISFAGLFWRSLLHFGLCWAFGVDCGAGHNTIIP